VALPAWLICLNILPLVLMLDWIHLCYFPYTWYELVSYCTASYLICFYVGIFLISRRFSSSSANQFLWLFSSRSLAVTVFFLCMSCNVIFLSSFMVSLSLSLSLSLSQQITLIFFTGWFEMQILFKSVTCWQAHHRPEEPRATCVKWSQQFAKQEQIYVMKYPCYAFSGLQYNTQG